MHPIAFHIGNVAIHWYGILVAIGFLAGFWTASRRAPLSGLSSESVADIGPWLIVGGLVGARLLYVITYWQEDFAGGPLTDIFKIREGGLVFYGGFIGAALCGIIYVRKNKIPTWKMADALAPSIALGHAFGRLGCLMTGCCYGKVCSLPWGITFPNDHITHPHAVHPTQIYESVFNFALFAGLTWVYRKKKFDGQVFALYLMAYAVLRAANELFRGDYEASKHFGLLTPGQLIGILILTTGLGLWFFCKRHSKEKQLTP
ncbi:prolipoprotein diacylglyceryl transferase [bacterium]|nr:prolipoprotein diacylglyceryl transferase [bacterium]